MRLLESKNPAGAGCGMVGNVPTWAYALVLKPLIAVAMFAVVFGGARLLMLLFRTLVPRGSWAHRWLFSDSWGAPAERATRERQGVLDHPPLLRGKSSEDRAGL